MIIRRTKDYKINPAVFSGFKLKLLFQNTDKILSISLPSLLEKYRHGKYCYSEGIGEPSV